LADSDEEDQATQFAQRIEDLLQHVLGANDTLYTAAPEGKLARGGRSSYVIHQLPEDGISINSDGECILKLSYTFHCSCKEPGSWLQVDKSSIMLTGEPKHVPLFRYDYVRSPSSDIPAAHLNVYGSNDTASRLMLACSGGKRTRNRRKEYLEKGAFPTFSSLHFPVGGDRLRPGLEDVLQMAVYEFHIDVEPEWENALNDSRAEYRQSQIKAIVREFPDLVYDELVESGHDLTKKPERQKRDDRPSMLIRY
jgi:hypothetical protein